jgi:hypothetical protein
MSVRAGRSRHRLRRARRQRGGVRSIRCRRSDRPDPRSGRRKTRGAFGSYRRRSFRGRSHCGRLGWRDGPRRSRLWCRCRRSDCRRGGRNGVTTARRRRRGSAGGPRAAVLSRPPRFARTTGCRRHQDFRARGGPWALPTDPGTRRPRCSCRRYWRWRCRHWRWRCRHWRWRCRHWRWRCRHRRWRCRDWRRRCRCHSRGLCQGELGHARRRCLPRLHRRFHGPRGRCRLLLRACLGDARRSAQRFRLHLLDQLRELREGTQRSPLVAAFAPGERLERDRASCRLATQLAQLDRPDRHAIDPDKPAVRCRLLRRCRRALGRGHRRGNRLRLDDGRRFVVVQFSGVCHCVRPGPARRFQRARGRRLRRG